MLDKLEKKTFIRFFFFLSGNLTHLMIEDLTHFSKYTVTIKACQREYYDDFQQTVTRRCSEIRSYDFRTEKKNGADDIDSKTVKSNSDSNNGTDVWITWTDPENPNLAIIYYNVKYRMQNTQELLKRCISASEFEQNNRKYVMSIPGTFNVQVCNHENTKMHLEFFEMNELK